MLEDYQNFNSFTEDFRKINCQEITGHDYFSYAYPFKPLIAIKLLIFNFLVNTNSIVLLQV